MDEQRWHFRDDDGVVMGPYTPERMGDLMRARHILDDTLCSEDQTTCAPDGPVGADVDLGLRRP